MRRFTLGDIAVQLNDLRDLIADGHGGIQRSHWILKDHGYFVAPDIQHFFFRRFQDIFSIQINGTAFYLCGRIRQNTQNRLCNGGLARAGFANQADGCSFLQVKGNAVDCVNDLAAGGILHDQIFNP